MIKLYGAGETEFKNNGYGGLSDAITCVVTEELNGAYELEMTYPINGIHYSDIVLRRIILAKPNSYTRPQPFRIYSISKPIDGIVTINAEHISYDLSGIPVSPVSPYYVTSPIAAFNTMKQNATTTCLFSFESNVTSEENLEMNMVVPRSIRSYMGTDDDSILSVYGGEYEYDRFLVRHLKNRGSNRGFTIRYGKNMTDLTQEENCAEVYTHVYPYYYAEDDGYQCLDEKLVPTSGTYEFQRILTLDLTSDFDEMPTQDQLRKRAQEYITEFNLGIPKVSMTVSFASIYQNTEFAGLEEVRIGDTVLVKFTELGVDNTAECIATEFDAITETYNNITLGESIKYLEDTIVDGAKIQNGIIGDIHDTNVSIGNEIDRAQEEEGKIKVSITKTNEMIATEISRASEAEGNLSSRITQTIDQITSEVNRATAAEGSLSSKITQTAESITSEVSRATAAEGSLSTRISQNAREITLRATHDDVSSAISIAVSGIKLTSSQISLEGLTTINGGFKVGLNGDVTLSSASFQNGIYYLYSGINFPIFEVPQQGILQLANSATHVKAMGSFQVVGGTTLGPTTISGNTPLTSGNYDTYCEPKGHTHYTGRIKVDSTGYDNIRFDSTLNGASVKYVQENFQRAESSDFRLKQNIMSLDNIETFYSELKPKMYNFKGDLDDECVHYGLLAQQVLSNAERNGVDVSGIIKEYDVRKYYDEGMYTGEKAYRINYEAFNAMHIYMIQKLMDRVTNLEQSNTQLQNEINTLKQRMEESAT